MKIRLLAVLAGIALLFGCSSNIPVNKTENTSATGNKSVNEVTYEDAESYLKWNYLYYPYYFDGQGPVKSDFINKEDLIIVSSKLLGEEYKVDNYAINSDNQNNKTSKYIAWAKEKGIIGNTLTEFEVGDKATYGDALKICFLGLGYIVPGLNDQNEYQLISPARAMGLFEGINEDIEELLYEPISSHDFIIMLYNTIKHSRLDGEILAEKLGLSDFGISWIYDSSIVNNGSIYFSNYNASGKLYKMDFTKKQTVKLSDDKVRGLEVDGRWIYYINDNDKGSLYRIVNDGNGREKLSSDEVYSYFINNGKVYINTSVDSSGKEGDIFRLDAEGKKTKLVSGIQVQKLFFDKDNIIYTDQYGKIYVVDDEGKLSNKIDLAYNVYIEYVENGWIYYGYLYGPTNGLYKIRTDGTQRTCLVSDAFYNPLIYKDYVYYAKRNGSGNSNIKEGVYRINKEPKGESKIFSSEVDSFYISEGKIYYIIKDKNTLLQKIYEMMPDGSRNKSIGDAKLYSIPNLSLIYFDGKYFYMSSHDDNYTYENYYRVDVSTGKVSEPFKTSFISFERYAFD